MDKEGNKQKINKKKIAIFTMIVILVILMIVLIIMSFGIKIKKQNNVANLGLVTSGDNYVFYSKQNEGIIKIKDKTEYQITDGLAYSLCYVNEYVYYLAPTNKGNVELRKVSQNGDDNTVLIEMTTSINKMYLENNYLYYSTSNPNTISRIDLNGNNGNIVITRTIGDFVVENGMVYFTDEAGYLYKITTDSKNYGIISDKILVKKFQVLDGYAYYYNEENRNLMKVNLENGQEEKVTDKLNCSTFNITDKAIFYLDKENKSICKINLDGKNPKEIVKVNTENTKISVDGDVLYYTDTLENSSSYRTFRIKINGKEVDEIKY